MSKATRTQITPLATLCTMIDRADACYYNGTESGIVDSIYDEWKEELRKRDPSNRRLSSVGAPPHKDSILTKQMHLGFMGSQNKATNPDEFKAWYKSVGEPEVYCNPKIDGGSLRSYYNDGDLRVAITRGDGKVGEDITANAVKFVQFPTQCPNDFTGSVRGEAVLFKKEWDKLDPDHTGNPRNIGCGIIQRSDGKQSEYIHFLAFDVVYEQMAKNTDAQQALATEENKIQLLKDLGFEVIDGGFVCRDLEEILEYFAEVEDNRADYPYWIDGVVIKINDLKKQDSLGISGGRPKGQISFKFEPEKGKSVLRKVVLSVGHTGAIIPTGEFDPVRLGGTTVTNALLCNWDNITSLDVAIGDTVIVHKGGEIIPQIVGVEKRPKDREPIPEPLECPECGGRAARRLNSDGKAGAVTECTNTECDAKVVGKLKRWIKSLDIKGLGDELINALSEQGIVSTVPDLYRLKDGWGELEGTGKTKAKKHLGCLQVNGRNFGRKNAVSVLEEIEKAKTLTIDQLLGSLGIKHLGKRRVQIIREAASRLPDIKSGHEHYNPSNLHFWLSNDEPESDAHLFSNLVCYADELGIPSIAESIQKGIDAKRQLIQELLELGVTLVAPEIPKAITGGKLSGQFFCLTGVMSRSRKEIASDIAAAGGTAVDDVKAGVKLVQADTSSVSSKSKKAIKLGCDVISEDELMEMLK
jgi:DNA ligase (NAD+)